MDLGLGDHMQHIDQVISSYLTALGLEGKTPGTVLPPPPE